MPSSLSSPETHVTFPSSDGNATLSGLLHVSNQGREHASTGLVFLHPHPKLGGNMHNNVVMAVKQCLALDGYTTLRFDTRGVGKSTGRSSWKGVAERSDVLGAVDYLLGLEGVERVVLVAYSFGAAVGCSVVDQRDEILGCVAISYPCGFWSSFLFSQHYKLANTSKPKLFLIGTADNFTSLKTIEQFFKKLHEPKTLKVFPGVDHFWFHHEQKLCQEIPSWLHALCSQDQDAQAKPMA